jgi:L-ascorbate metabolism protein UlaG (beta-lactamase superfamily)
MKTNRRGRAAGFPDRPYFSFGAILRKPLKSPPKTGCLSKKHHSGSSRKVFLRWTQNMDKKAIGKLPSGKRLERIRSSENYRDGAFRNIEPTEVMLRGSSWMKLLKDFAAKPSNVRPSGILPSVKSNLKSSEEGAAVITWFGHSSYLIRSGGFNVLVDPVFNNPASPVGFFGKPFRGSDIYSFEHFPVIDLLLITHDHYDHLSYPTILKLREKIKKAVVPLGVGEHLEYWGISPDLITELDWWETCQIAENVSVTATPSRHFSGRGIVRNKSLWTSYALSFCGLKLFVGGDSGYDAQFAKIGELFGPFDLAMLENGQYGDSWPHIHMLPEETVKAALDLRAQALLPVHWGKFALSYHAWNDPVRRLHKAAEKFSLRLVSPKIGETHSIGSFPEASRWWEEQ